MVSELAAKLGFRHEFSSSYYPQAKGQVEAVNKTLKTMLQRTINENKNNWHIMFFSALWAYCTSVKSVTGFTPFQLVHGVEAILLIDCEIPSLKLAISLIPDKSAEEERIVYLEQLDEHRRYATTANKAHKRRVKEKYDKSVRPRVFIEGDLVLLYD